MCPYGANKKHDIQRKHKLKINVYSAPFVSISFINIGSGRVVDKIPVSGSGSGRVGVSKNTIGYFRVSFLLSGISGYFGHLPMTAPSSCHMMKEA